jgi:phage-related protein
MAENLEDLVIKIRLEGEQTKAELEGLKKQVQNFGGEVNHVKEPVNGLKAQFSELGKSIGKAFAAAEIVRFLVESTKVAGDNAESFAVLQNQLKNTTGATEKQSEAIDKQLESMSEMSGTKMPELRIAFGSLVRATGDSTKALALQQTALDLAASAHIPLETAAKALGKAVNGNTSALTRLDPALKGSKNLLGDLEKQTKGAAKAAADTNPMKRMQVEFEHIQVALGNGLLPVMRLVSDLLMKLTPVFDMVGKIIGAIAKPVMALVNVFMKALMPILNMLIPIFMQLMGSIMKPLTSLINNALVPAFGLIGDVLKTIMPFIKLLGSLVGGYLNVMLRIWSVEIQILVKVFTVLWNIMKPFVQFIENAVIGAIKNLISWLKPIWAVVKPMVDAIAKLLGININMKASVDTSGANKSLADMKAPKLSSSLNFNSGGAGGGGGSGSGSGSTHHHKHTHITTKVTAKTDAKPQDIAANIVNAIKFNLPVGVTGSGSGTLSVGAGSEVGGLGMAGA